MAQRQSDLLERVVDHRPHRSATATRAPSATTAAPGRRRPVRRARRGPSAVRPRGRACEPARLLTPASAPYLVQHAAIGSLELLERPIVAHDVVGTRRLLVLGQLAPLAALDVLVVRGRPRARRAAPRRPPRRSSRRRGPRCPPRTAAAPRPPPRRPRLAPRARPATRRSAPPRAGTATLEPAQLGRVIEHDRATAPGRPRRPRRRDRPSAPAAGRAPRRCRAARARPCRSRGRGAEPLAGGQRLRLAGAEASGQADEQQGLGLFLVAARRRSGGLGRARPLGLRRGL